MGETLLGELAKPQWTKFDAGAAWARHSGVRHLVPALQRFLARGGAIRFVVGLAYQQTSREALQAFLALKAHGSCETWVHHNENGPIFHPKMYLLRGSRQAQLFVGSSNLTEGGLFTNVEANLGLRDSVRAAVIVGAMRELDRWRSDTRLCRRLDAALLAQLVAGEYVTDEAKIPRPPQLKRGADTSGKKRPRLFGTVRRSAPTPPPGSAPSAPATPRSGGTRASATGPAHRRPGGRVLIVEVPRSGGRWSQVNFDIATIRSYFKIKPGSRLKLLLTNRAPGSQFGDQERRPCVDSGRSMNYRIEIGAGHGRQYPKEGRPLVVFLRMAPRQFRYVLLLPGDVGYDVVAAMLSRGSGEDGRMLRLTTSVAELNRAWPANSLAAT